LLPSLAPLSGFFHREICGKDEITLNTSAGTYPEKRRGKRKMFDFATIILAGAGGTSLAVAFIDYLFSAKRKSHRD